MEVHHRLAHESRWHSSFQLPSRAKLQNLEKTGCFSRPLTRFIKAFYGKVEEVDLGEALLPDA